MRVDRILAAAMLVLAAVALFLARDQWLAGALKTDAVYATQDRCLPDTGPYLPGAGRGAVNLQLLEAAALTRCASLFPEGARASFLSRAQSRLSHVLALRPEAGQATLLRAYAVGLRSGRGTPEVTRLVAESYRQAPFLRDEGEWRVRYVTTHWIDADAVLRRRSVEEALWLSTLSVARASHIWRIVANTPMGPLVDARARRMADYPLDSATRYRLQHGLPNRPARLPEPIQDY